MELLQQQITGFTSSNITESVLDWNATVKTAGTFIVGVSYTIISVGTTNFTLIGAASNTIGVVFTATGVGSGTGTAQTTYLAGQYAVFGSYIYKSVSLNVNMSPETNTGIFWVKWQVSNKTAMLDVSANSKSYYNGGNLTVEFLKGTITAVAVGNYEAETVLFEVLDELNVVVFTHETENALNENVFDYWDYVYEDYGYEVDRAYKVNLVETGHKVRVTFKKSADSTRTACGFLSGGVPYSMGTTLNRVSFGFNSYAVRDTDAFGTLTITKRAVQDTLDFETLIPNGEVPVMRRKIKNIYNDIIVFIVDESESSTYENIIVLGAVQNAGIVITEFDKTTMTWGIIEAI